jgi:3-phosphoshikimate 1-carboxyvinyltransferase
MSVPVVNEAPYIQMTLDWMKSLGIQVDYATDYSRFEIPGGQSWSGFDRPIAADFSSATFFLVAGAALDAEIELTGLDTGDSQGDKEVLDYLRRMGADIRVDEARRVVRVRRGNLRGADLDLNRTPDALPAMAVAAALAEGTTRLLNTPNARLKETDRIAVMALELRKMGVEVEELPDGLVIQGRPEGLRASKELNGHGDHRIVMALSLAAMAARDGSSEISTAEAMAVTFPEFKNLMSGLGADMELL